MFAVLTAFMKRVNRSNKLLTKENCGGIIFKNVLNAKTELLLNFGVQRAVRLVKARYTFLSQVSFLSRAAEFLVSCYGASRYHGERLVGALLSDHVIW